MFDTPPVPQRVTALVESGRLPPSLAECFDPANMFLDEPPWREVAWMIDIHLANPDLDPGLRGELALMGAHAYIETCEYEMLELGKRSDRALELLREARRYGIPDSELEPLFRSAWDTNEVAADIEN